MTEERYNQVVDEVLSCLVLKSLEVSAEVGNSLLDVLNVAGVPHLADVGKLCRADLFEALDSLAYNSIEADIADDRYNHVNYFQKLQREAKKRAHADFYGDVCVGEVSCVISAGGELYYGKNVDADCGLGVCAERVALMQAMSLGRGSIKFVLTCDADGKIKRPCGACLEFMSQAGLWDTWIAMEDGLWIPMRKVGWYASFH